MLMMHWRCIFERLFMHCLQRGSSLSTRTPMLASKVTACICSGSAPSRSRSNHSSLLRYDSDAATSLIARMLIVDGGADPNEGAVTEVIEATCGGCGDCSDCDTSCDSVYAGWRDRGYVGGGLGVRRRRVSNIAGEHTPLQRSSSTLPRTIATLLELGADYENVESSRFGPFTNATPLEVAVVMNKEPAVLRAFMAHGASVSVSSIPTVVGADVQLSAGDKVWERVGRMTADRIQVLDSGFDPEVLAAKGLNLVAGRGQLGAEGVFGYVIREEETQE